MSDEEFMILARTCMNCTCSACIVLKKEFSDQLKNKLEGMSN